MGWKIPEGSGATLRVGDGMASGEKVRAHDRAGAMPSRRGSEDIGVQAGPQQRVLGLHPPCRPTCAEPTPENRAPHTGTHPQFPEGPNLEGRVPGPLPSQWWREGPGGDLDGLRPQAQVRGRGFLLCKPLVYGPSLRQRQDLGSAQRPHPGGQNPA